MKFQTIVRLGFIALILLSSGCGATPSVSVKNFENRDHPQLRDEYLWFELEWRQ